MWKVAKIIMLSKEINPLNAELNPIRHLLALVGARHIVHVSRIRVKELSTPIKDRPISLLDSLAKI